MAAAFIVLVAAEAEERKKLKLLRKNLRDSSDPFSIQESQFRSLYRLSKDAVRELCVQLRPYVEEEIRATAIPFELKVLAALNFMASGSYQRRIGQDFLSCMCQSSMSKILHQIIEGMNQIMGEWIKFPTQQHEIQHIKEQFWNNCQFPGAIGAVDGVHVAIWPPEMQREHLYLNRKLYHSLNVMLISDYNLRILAVNAGHGGRTHDSRVWNASEISVYLEEEHRNGRTSTWLLGDSGYPLLPYLMTPKLNAIQGSPSAAYTNAHVKARCSVERCIGVLKGRWRCLRKERMLHYKPEFAALIVNAGCVLHNVAKWYNVPDPEPYFDDIDHQVEENVIGVVDVPNRHAGNEVRENLIRRFFT